jgi:Cupredoxin-like domain
MKGFFGIGLVLVIWATATLSWADILLAPPPPPAPMPRADENYPVSRFGLDPARTDEDRTNRSPAGLEFSDQTGQAKASPIIPEKGMPKTLSNLNPKPPANTRTGVQEISLIAGDLGFFPKVVFATRDIPLRIFVTGASKKPLCIMIDSFQVRKQVRAQKIEEISFTPTETGQYRFYCPVNGMEGTLLVKDPSASSLAHSSSDSLTPTRSLSSENNSEQNSEGE